jgi:hydroxymethyl cephem carbamoyltransferase
MLILAVNCAAPGAHDGAVAAVRDRQLLFSIESEKDSFPRNAPFEPTAMLNLAEHLDQTPDVIAVGGGLKPPPTLGYPHIGAGYEGVEEGRLVPGKFFGRDVQMFTSSHERSHIMMSIGLAPGIESDRHGVVVWEGGLGHLYLLDGDLKVILRQEVLRQPGNRYAFIYGLADKNLPDTHQGGVVMANAGKLMALAAYGDPNTTDPAAVETVDRIIGVESLLKPGVSRGSKVEWQDSPLYNIGVEHQLTKDTAALLTKRIFDVFAEAAQRHLPEGIPFYIGGGCGLNCDWNVMWRDLGHFSSVFVPPCTSDSGSAIGTALDALYAATGDPHIDWTVYSGLEFEWDRDPDPARWKRQPLDEKALVEALSKGRVVAWVQGRWEIGPRALGNRSLLAEPFSPGMRDELNRIKRREEFRPVAPACRLDDADELFTDASDDPYMLYFRHVKGDRLGAVTHVDGTARSQMVTAESNEKLYRLLTTFAERHGVGILCNTSLNFKGCGFINRMSDLVNYCERRGVPDMVVGDAWFTDTQARQEGGTA